jgi:hypothetical protein
MGLLIQAAMAQLYASGRDTVKLFSRRYFAFAKMPASGCHGGTDGTFLRTCLIAKSGRLRWQID